METLKTYRGIIALTGILGIVFITAAFGHIKSNDRYKKVLVEQIVKLNSAASEDVVKLIVENVEANDKVYTAGKCLVYGLIMTESNFDVNAVSSAGAIGLMQVMPSVWGEEYSVSRKDLLKISTNIDVGTSILLSYIDGQDGNLTNALGKYNGTTSNDFSDKVYRNCGLIYSSVERRLNNE